MADEAEQRTLRLPTEVANLVANRAARPVLDWRLLYAFARRARWAILEGDAPPTATMLDPDRGHFVVRESYLSKAEHPLIEYVASVLPPAVDLEEQGIGEQYWISVTVTPSLVTNEMEILIANLMYNFLYFWGCVHAFAPVPENLTARYRASALFRTAMSEFKTRATKVREYGRFELRPTDDVHPDDGIVARRHPAAMEVEGGVPGCFLQMMLPLQTPRGWSAESVVDYTLPALAAFQFSIPRATFWEHARAVESTLRANDALPLVHHAMEPPIRVRDAMALHAALMEIAEPDLVYDGLPDRIEE
jgi:hypothetical protein